MMYMIGTAIIPHNMIIEKKSVDSLSIWEQKTVLLQLEMATLPARIEN